MGGKEGRRERSGRRREGEGKREEEVERRRMEGGRHRKRCREWKGNREKD